MEVWSIFSSSCEQKGHSPLVDILRCGNLPLLRRIPLTSFEAKNYSLGHNHQQFLIDRLEKQAQTRAMLSQKDIQLFRFQPYIWFRTWDACKSAKGNKQSHVNVTDIIDTISIPCQCHRYYRYHITMNDKSIINDEINIKTIISDIIIHSRYCGTKRCQMDFHHLMI